MKTKKSKPTLKPMRSTPLTLVATLCVATVLGACASLGGQSPEEQVRMRANARWKTLVAGEFAKAYEYNTPGYRALVSQEVARGRIGSAVTWLGAEAVEVKCPTPDKCIANVKLDFKPFLRGKAGDKLETYFEETWLLENQQWWFFQDVK